MSLASDFESNVGLAYSPSMLQANCTRFLLDQHLGPFQTRMRLKGRRDLSNVSILRRVLLQSHTKVVEEECYTAVSLLRQSDQSCSTR